MSDPLRVVPVTLPLPIARNLLLSWKTLKRLVSSRRRVALVHVHQPHGQSLAALIGSRLLGIPSVVTYHVLVPEPRVLQRLKAKLLTRAQSRYADRVVVLSQSTARAFGLSRYVVIPNGVQVPPSARESSRSSDGPGAGGLEVVFAGRVTRSKGIYVVLEALAHARHEVPGLHMTTYGQVDEPAEYARAKQSFGVEDLVHDAGFDPRWTDSLRRAQVFVLPSYYEGMPLALLEAMAAGLFVIASDVGLIPEVVRVNETGRLVNPGDSQALAASIAWAYRNPQEAAEIGRRARSLMTRDFSLEATASAYARLYEELHAGSRGR